MVAAKPFDRETLLRALAELGRRLHATGHIVEIAIYGGSAILLMLNSRPATKDVDAVFEQDKPLVRRIAAEMAEEHGWDPNWLNDGVKGFLSAAEKDPASKIFIGTYPSEEEPGLRVFVPKLEYLFAMKSLAMRLGDADERGDIDDIRRLARAIGVATAKAAMDLVESFYPHHLIPAKTKFGLEEIFANQENGKSTSP